MDWIRYDALNDEYLLQHNNLEMISLEKPAERPQDYQGKYWKVDVEFLISACLPTGNLPI